MTSDTITASLLAAHTELRMFNDELKALDRRRELSPEMRSLLYSTRDTMRNHNNALREIAQAVADLQGVAAEWR